jgi:hypothetical protein
VETVLLLDLLQLAAAEGVSGKHHPVLVAPAAALEHLVKVSLALQDQGPRVKETMAVMEPITLMVLIVLAEAEAAQAVLVLALE